MIRESFIRLSSSFILLVSESLGYILTDYDMVKLLRHSYISSGFSCNGLRFLATTFSWTCDRVGMYCDLTDMF